MVRLLLLVFLSLGIRITPIGPYTTASPCTTPASGCPTNGSWSDWTPITACNDTCGSCGTQLMRRTCLSASYGCPCTGVSEYYALCGIGVCLYPRDDCCAPYTEQIINGTFACGPIPQPPSGSMISNSLDYDYYGEPSTPCTPTPTAATSIKCQCNLQSVFLDLIFLVDASASTGEDGLNEMWNSAATMLDSLNVQKNGYTGTVGVITYGNTAKVVYPLGSIDNNDIDGILGLPYNGDKTTNLEAAIQAGVQQFNGPNHRSNARRVMFTMAAVYNPDGVTAPLKAATTFKESDGIMIVYNFFPEGGIESSTLKEVSSPGYYFSTVLNSHLQDMEASLCDANCFCPQQQRSYTTDSVRGTPSDGCYMEVKTDTSYARAQNVCRSQYNNATVTLDQSVDKTAFLKSMFSPTSTAFYIGLTWDSIDRTWEWPDGSQFGSYQPWAPGTTHDGNGQQCVYVNPQGLWQTVDCRQGYYYVCEMIPCDSGHYCS